jgi:hypothetical protein
MSDLEPVSTISGLPGQILSDVASELPGEVALPTPLEMFAFSEKFHKDNWDILRRPYSCVARLVCGDKGPVTVGFDSSDYGRNRFGWEVHTEQTRDYFVSVVMRTSAHFGVHYQRDSQGLRRKEAEGGLDDSEQAWLNGLIMSLMVHPSVEEELARVKQEREDCEDKISTKALLHQAKKLSSGALVVLNEDVVYGLPAIRMRAQELRGRSPLTVAQERVTR